MQAQLAVSQEPEEQRRVKRLYDVAVLDLSGQLPQEYVPQESWVRFINRVLKLGRPSLLNARLEHDRALDGKPFRAIPLSDKVQPLRVGIVTPAENVASRAAAAFAEHCHSAWAAKRFPCQAAPIPDEILGETKTGGELRSPKTFSTKDGP